MKIAFVYDVLYPDTIGGVEKRIYEIGKRLAKRGHEVHVFPMTTGSGNEIIRRDGLIIHPVCRPIGLYTGGRRSVFQAVWYALHLFPVLLRIRVDIIDCQNFPYFPIVISRIIGWLRHENYVITWHECWGEFWYQYLGLGGFFGRLTEKFSLLLSHHSIAVSHHTVTRMKAEEKTCEPIIIPNGITLDDITIIQPFTKQVDVIFVGRFIPEKHPELVIEAIRILVHTYPAITCSLIGDGPMMSELHEKIHDYRLSDNIHLEGFISDYKEVIGRIKSARVFVLPSEREGFGIVCVEALACNVPIVTTQYPLNAACDHVLPGCGYAAMPNAQDIAEGIQMYLFRQPDVSVIHDYIKKHDWDTIVCLLEQTYNKLILSK
jgi:glycosyltransferase involved in cell wall biosynthesis